MKRKYKKRFIPALDDAFDLRVNKTDSCWLWTGVVNKDGYGRLFIGNNKYVMAHRYSYERYVGTIPEDCEIDHLCRVRNCVNPDHLDPVKHIVNIHRGGNTKKTHCIHGHEFTPDNTGIGKRGNRICKTCANMKSKLYRENNTEKVREYMKKYREKNKLCK